MISIVLVPACGGNKTAVLDEMTQKQGEKCTQAVLSPAEIIRGYCRVLGWDCWYQASFKTLTNGTGRQKRQRQAGRASEVSDSRETTTGAADFEEEV